MSDDKIIKAIEAAITKLEGKVIDLEQQLKTTKSELTHKRDLLKMAARGSRDQQTLKEEL